MANKVLMALAEDNRPESSHGRGIGIVKKLAVQEIHCDLRVVIGTLELWYFVLDILRFDVIFFQNTYSIPHYLLMRMAMILKKQTVLDLDVPASHLANLMSMRTVKLMMRHVSIVTVSNSSLYQVVRKYQKNVYKIPSGTDSTFINLLKK